MNDSNGQQGRDDNCHNIQLNYNVSYAFLASNVSSDFYTPK